ncbi:hypothetical protein D3C72_1491810 [compost metagenome]
MRLSNAALGAPGAQLCSSASRTSCMEMVSLPAISCISPYLSCLTAILGATTENASVASYRRCQAQERLDQTQFAATLQAADHMLIDQPRPDNRPCHHPRVMTDLD